MSKVKNTGAIKVRRFREADLPAVHKLIQKTIDISYNKVYPKEANDFFKEFHCPETILKDAKAGYIVVAERDGELLGTSTLIGSHIQRTFVNPECQRQGIGGMIADELEKKAAMEKPAAITLEASLVSRRFWESWGYKFQKECAIPVKNGQKLIYFNMIKEIKEHGL